MAEIVLDLKSVVIAIHLHTSSPNIKRVVLCVVIVVIVAAFMRTF